MRKLSDSGDGFAAQRCIFEESRTAADLDGDGSVGILDFLMLPANWR